MAKGGSMLAGCVLVCLALCAVPSALQAFSLASGAAQHTTPRRHLRSATEDDMQSAAASTTATATCASLGVAVAAATAAVAAIGASRRRTGVVSPPARLTQVARAAGETGSKRILVMGGTRFIGCYLVKTLRDQGHEVVVLNRGKKNGGKPEPLPGMSDAEYEKMMEGVSVIVADRTQPEEMKKLIIESGKFDIVYDNNARKLTDVDPLAEAITASGGCEQFIFMSSAGVYGPTDILPLSEANPGDPNSRHKEKLSCENYLDSKGFNWTSIRPVYIYGPLNYNPVERFFFDRVARGRPICVPYDGKFITQLGHCEDLAVFMAACIGNPAVSKQVYNVSGEEYVTFDGMAKVCAEAAGMPEPKIVHYDPKAIKVPEGFPKAFPFRGMHFFASIDKAKTDIPNWKPNYSLLNGLKSSYEEDYVARGFDKKDVDFSTDDLILKAMGEA